MFLYVLMIILGLILLVIGAEFLVRGASNIAIRFKIPELLIGLTIVALGTSAPELIITITSAQSGYTDLIIGNAIGSNFCNLLLILGLTALIYPVKVSKETKHIHIPVAIFSALILLFMEVSSLMSETSFLDRTDGIILVIFFSIYFLYPIFLEIKGIIQAYKENKSQKNGKQKNIFISILLIALGVVLLKYGGDFVVDNATSIARALNISERVIGLTIVAIGTAMPELVTSIIAAFKKDTDLAVGNLVGSCVLNIFLILGVGAIITPLEFSTEFRQNVILLAFATFILWLLNFVGKKNTITRPKGLLLLCIFSIYIVKLFYVL